MLENGDKKKPRLSIAKGIIIVLFVLYIGYLCGSYNKQDQVAEVSQGTKIDLQDIPDGMYKVGEDIPSGEYLLTNDNPSRYQAYFKVTTDSTGSSKSIVSNGNFYDQRYITVKDGEYIRISGCNTKKVN